MNAKERIESLELTSYRHQARSWLAANMTARQRNPDGSLISTDGFGPSAERVAQGRTLQKKLFDGGFAGITYPTEYGGQGLTLAHERVFLQEALSYHMPTRMFGVSLNILGPTLIEFGTDAQKAAHLPRMLAGQEIWLQFLSEPSGGSDLAGLLTRATRDGDSYVVNGQKIWSTGAQYADFAMCPVRTRWDVPKHKGISVLIVDLGSPGVDIRPIKQINEDAEFCEEFLTEVMVPAENLIGQENEGWRVVRGLLEIEHAWVGRSGASASSASGVNDLVALARQRGLAGDLGARRRIAAMHAAQEVHALTAARVSNAIAAGKLNHGYGGALKVGGSTLVQRRTELAMSLAGCAGVAWEGESAKTPSLTFLNARRFSIGGGTNEVQRNNVSENGLGLPRELSVERDLPFNQVPRN